MESFDTSAPRPLAHIPQIPIFDSLEFNRSLPASHYTLIKTDDLIHRGDAAQSLVIDDSESVKPAVVERVPPEILSMIFEQAVPPQTDDKDPRKTHHLAEILLPGQICRLWTEAAIATPSLWSSLYFDFYTARNSAERMVDMATTFIARAKSCPLFIYLNIWTTELTQYRPVIAVLLARSHQWDNLVTYLQENAREALQGATGRLSMLRRLKVYSRGIGECQWSAFDTFAISPKLRIVDLHDCGEHWHEIGKLPLLPWRQLQQIACTGHVRDALQLLQMSPSLQVFKACVWGHSEVLHHVHHAFLLELSVESRQNGAASDLFGAVTLPALLSLSYAGEDFPRDAITSLVHRSQISQSLHTFSLTLYKRPDTPLMPSSDISECLKCMPGLSQLSLHDRFRSNRYTDTGSPSHSGDISSICELFEPRSILPKLKRFSITGPPRMSCILVAQMVRWRWRDIDEAAGAPVRLESVEFNYPGSCAHAKSSMTQIPHPTSKSHHKYPVEASVLARVEQRPDAKLQSLSSPLRAEAYVNLAAATHRVVLCLLRCT